MGLMDYTAVELGKKIKTDTSPALIFLPSTAAV